ncbi:MAG TPA: dTMP kinase [Ktedonobacterales bacterium]|nr:dTMP kinase [Ktedonobacterales bacterium]
MFITFEGGEGSGKSSQVALLAERLRSDGRAVRTTREPGGTPFAGAIRALLLHPEESLRALCEGGLATHDEPAEPMLPITEALLFSAARAQHVARMREWLAAGEIVICDRYADTTRAYQGVARGLDMETIDTLERLATDGLRPDLTFLLDLPVEVGQARRRNMTDGDWNWLDAETVAFHERVRAAYLALAAAEPKRWVVLDATQLPDTLAESIWQTVMSRLDTERA